MTDAGPPPARLTTAVARTRDGRILAGVCAGLPPIAGLTTGRLRLVFCLAALCGGIGIVVYLACWLILPDDAVEEEDATGVRGAVLLAWAAGGLVVALLLAGAGALAAALGLGWVVLGVACLLLVAGLSGQTRMPSSGALLAIAALTLPATAVALSPVRIALAPGSSVSRPQTTAAVRSTVFRSGLGTRLVDLRHTSLPRAGTVTMGIDGGLRRTIVALPSDRCVHVTVRYDVHTFVSDLATRLAGRPQPPFRDVVLFNRVYGGSVPTAPHGVATSGGARSGPTLIIRFSSLGGSLFVRDYPDDMSPQLSPGWPGYPVGLERRPDLTGEPRAVARTMIRAWRGRRSVDRAERSRYERSLPGPCA